MVESTYQGRGQVLSLLHEDSTCHGATKPRHCNYWLCGLEQVRCNKRSPCKEKTALQLESSPCSAQ